MVEVEDITNGSPPREKKRGAGAGSSTQVQASDAGEAEPNPMGDMSLGQVARQLIMLPVLWGSNKIDWEDPNSLLALQVAFGVVIVTVRRRPSGCISARSTHCAPTPHDRAPHTRPFCCSR